MQTKQRAMKIKKDQKLTKHSRFILESKLLFAHWKVKM